MHRKLILTAAAVAALGVSAPAAQAAFPGQNGPILFGTSSDDGTGIFSTWPTGSPSLLLATDPEGTPDGVDTTADGKRIAYNESDYSIWVADADGSDKKRITPEGADDFAPSWSPDGKKIAFASRESDGESDFTLWTMNADGTGRDELGADEDPIYGYQPAWSPDGTTIAFTEYGYLVARGRGYHAIAVTDPAGEDVDYLTDGADPEWTPDGRSIVHTDSVFGHGDLWRYDLAADDDVQLTDGEDGHWYRLPSVSPDGKHIVAEVETGGQVPARGGDWSYDLGVLSIDGTGTTILSGTTSAGGVEWSAAPAQPVVVRHEQQPPAPPAPQQAPASTTAPSKARVCGSRRYFNITVINKGLKRVSITLNGKTVGAKRKGRGFSARVDLRTLPKGRFTVKIRKTLGGGEVRSETRRYRTCVPKARA
jgi:Tol biopolymer transport system component